MYDVACDVGTCYKADKIAERRLKYITDTASSCKYGKACESKHYINSGRSCTFVFTEEYTCQCSKQELERKGTNGYRYAYICTCGNERRKQRSKYNIPCFVLSSDNSHILSIIYYIIIGALCQPVSMQKVTTRR